MERNLEMCDIRQKQAGIIVFLALLVVPLGPAWCVEIMGAWYRADTRFPEYIDLWHEGFSDRDPILGGGDYAYEGMPLGASVHVYIRNDTDEALDLSDMVYEGVSMRRAIAAGDEHGKEYQRASSIYFSDLPAEERDRLVSAGEPVWWRIEPERLPPGGVAEAMIRLRRGPEGNTVEIGLPVGEEVRKRSVAVDPSVPRIMGISFGPELKKIFAYFQHPTAKGMAPVKILMDGEDVTEHAVISGDPAVDPVPVVMDLPEALEPASLHVFQAVYSDGSVAWGAIRAWHFDFAYGIWGSRPGKEDEVEKARDYVNDIYTHMMNVQMEMVGSAAVAGYLKSDEGLARCDELGLRRMVADPGKGRTKEPFAYFLQDEPDAHDYEFKELDIRKRVGAMGQWLVRRSARIRSLDPATPHLLNVDVTFKPENWPMYGQLPDILAADPYYQPRLRECYERHPDRLPQYTKATYIHAVASEVQAAAAPKPTHLILYSVRHTRDQIFRYPTPEEKRIEVFYSIAAGAKGISYWWYTPIPPAYGVGAPEEEARVLWNEIGVMGVELRTAGPVLTRSCPAELEMAASPGLWVRALLAGRDTVVLVCVNDKYLNDRVGTVYVPLEDAKVDLRPPSWMEAAEVFEVTEDGTKDITHRDAGEGITVDLGRVAVTRLVIITSDKELRDRLEKRYQDEYAERAKSLRWEISLH